jgi:hypothetical protein
MKKWRGTSKIKILNSDSELQNWRASMGRNVGAEHAPIYL